MSAIFIPFNKNNSFEVEKNYIIDNYLDKSKNMGYSIVRTHLNGKHPLMKNIISNRTYYIIYGNASFDVDNEHFELKQGDTLTISKDTLYKFEGVFDAILISCPAFEEKYDVIYRE